MCGCLEPYVSAATVDARDALFVTLCALTILILVVDCWLYVVSDERMNPTTDMV